MKILMKIIFYIGFLFFGGGFLIAFCQFVAYNGLGNFFEYKKADSIKINYETTFSNKIEITNIYYLYTVNNKSYNSHESIATSSIKEKEIQIDKIYYNDFFPFLNYVGNNGLNLRKAISGMIIMGFFFLFLFLIYKFADMDKWIGIYTRGEYKSSKKTA